MAGINPFGPEIPVEGKFGWRGWDVVVHADHYQDVVAIRMSGGGCSCSMGADKHYWMEPSNRVAVLDKMAYEMNYGKKTESVEMPTFTKKHYEVVARVLKNSAASVTQLPGDTTEIQLGITAVASMLIEEFAKDNPRFNKQAFIEAVTKE